MYRNLVSAIAGMLVIAAPLSARAEGIAPGVEYTEYHLSGPNNVVHVVAIDRLRSEYKLAVGFPQKKRNFPSRQPTSSIATAYDNPPACDVLAATNGSFFGGTGIDIIGTAASDGEILEQPDSQNDTFLFGPSRVPVIRSGIQRASGILRFANGNVAALLHYNRPDPPIHDITAYTPQWDTSTRSNFTLPDYAVEVILEDVSYPMRGDKEVSGIVTAIRTGLQASDNPIPAGGMVLSAWGRSKDKIIANTQVGDRLRMWFDTSANEYNNADMAITGIGWIIHDGMPNTSNWAARTAAAPYSRNPRTVLGWNDTHIYMVVCDGRSVSSAGMTFSEMATFLTGTLDARDAINLDGGGSSTMVVNGAVRNAPSDGTQRSVANAVLLVRKPPTSVLPFVDPFNVDGRLDGWEDKFTFNGVSAFSPAAPAGDGYVVEVADPSGGVETLRRGDLNDADYTVEADIYCEHRPGLAGDGFERYGLFIRDSGTGAFGLSSFGGGNCYAMTFDSDDGRIRAGAYVDGVLNDFLAGDPLYAPSTAWRNFRITCAGSTIDYYLDDVLVASVTDTTYAQGFYGLGYQSFFTSNANIHGTRADRLSAYAAPPSAAADFDGDEDVDQEDFGHLQECYSGSAVVQTRPECFDARLDDDADVDSDDFALFQACMSGPDVPADPACDD